jgi:two-component system sensor histidine kinase/response regulator
VVLSPPFSLSTLPEQDPPGGDVLIVDDFVDARALYEALLSEDGHKVRTASSGADALALVEQSEPELVLLDVSMPGMDGVEVLRRLRSRRGGGPAVLMLTAARREPHAIEAGLKQGADAYLTKPIDARELLARTRAALESHRLKRIVEGQRRDHIAMLVHDLRHPLSSLGLVAEVLDADDIGDDERRAAVTTIRGLCRDMARLIDGVLVASRLEAGVFSVERSPVTVGAVLRATLGVFEPLAAHRHVILTFEGAFEQPVLADAPKLRQAIDNLIANALKFTPRGGKVRVRVSREKDGGGRASVVFDVSDNGPGIAESERPTIFDRYKQGTRGRAAGGAGLGLAIARGIAEAHGGTISVGSGDLGGASFRLMVPD